MKLVLLTDDRHSLGTLSGIEAEDLTDPMRQRIVIDELRSLLDRSELAPHTDACTGATQPLPVPQDTDTRARELIAEQRATIATWLDIPTAPESLGTRLWNRLIWRAR